MEVSGRVREKENTERAFAVQYVEEKDRLNKRMK